MKNPNLNKQTDFTKKKNKFGGAGTLKLSNFKIDLVEGALNLVF